MSDENTHEFTSRYEALGMPLPDPETMCKGDCEGTGFYPVKNPFVASAVHSHNDLPTNAMLKEPKPPTVDIAKLEALKTAEPYKVQPRVPDYFQVLTGWRAWRVTGKDGQFRLKAVGQDTVWRPKKQIEAVCVSGGFRSVGSVFSVSSSPAHPAPHSSCECGIWAFKGLDSLVAALGNEYAQITVLGQVSLWGKVIETVNGYRAEKAYPSELWLMDSELEELGFIYDVPVRMIRN